MIGEGYRLTEAHGGQATGIPSDLVDHVAETLEQFGVDFGPYGRDAVARALLAEQGWRMREAADEAAHARRRDDPVRLVETRTILDLAEARRRAREHEVRRTLDGISGAMAQSLGTRHS